MTSIGRLHRVVVATDLDGSELALTAVDLEWGDGPTIGVVAGVGMGEWLSVHVVHALYAMARSGGAESVGTLRLVPVGDPLGFATVASEIGPAGLQASLESEDSVPARSRAVLTDLLSEVDLAVEMRSGSCGSIVLGVTAVEPAGTRSNQAAAAVASALPGPRVSTSAADPRDATGTRLALGQVLDRGVPLVSACVGGTGVGADVEEAWVQRTAHALVTGIRAVTNTSAATVADQLGRPVRVTPRAGGLLDPVVPATSLLGSKVDAGTTLAVIRSPYSFLELERLVTPVAGIVVQAATARPVRPGEPSFAVAPTAN